MNMKAYIVQPYYSFEEDDIQKCFDGMIDLLDTVGEDADIIVFDQDIHVSDVFVGGIKEI